MSKFSRLAISALAFASTHASFANDYSWKEGNADSRAYYTEFSDSEYASLKPAPEPLPILLESWKDGPIPRESFIIQPLRVTRDADVERQKLALNQPDPAFRSRIISILADGKSPKSTPILVEQLNTEKDPRTRADLLSALTWLKASYPLDQILQSQKAPLAAERAAAVGLYLVQENADRATAWQLAETDNAAEVRLASLRALALAPQYAELEKWKSLVETPPIQSADRIATKAILSTDGLSQDEFLKFAESANARFVTAIAESLPGKLSADASAVVAKLLKHPHTSAQSAACLAANRTPAPSHLEDLIRLTSSKVSEVRRAAATALQHHPKQPAVDALVKLAGDEVSVLVRRAARTSLEQLAPKFEIAKQLPGWVNDPSELRREQIFILSTNIAANTAGSELSARLDKEPNPVNLAVLVRALSMAHHQPSATPVFALADHESPLVRAAVAFAIGHLPIDNQRKKLGQYLLTDRASEVRVDAMRAMAHIGTDEFDGDLLTILNRTNYAAQGDKAEYLTSEDRSLSAWTAARTESLSPALVKRLIKQVTHMVIKTELGPTHDSSNVRMSATFCLVEHLKKQPEDKALKRAVKETTRVLTSETPINQAPVDPVTNHYGAQAEAWLNDTPIDRSYPRTLRYRMLFEPLPKRRTASYPPPQ